RAARRSRWLPRRCCASYPAAESGNPGRFALAPSARGQCRMSNETHRAGHVAVIGRPNVGKSTLVNALVGANLSIVSNRPQTTRHRLLGIATVPGGQIVLVDTPGLHRDDGKRASTALNRV